MDQESLADAVDRLLDRLTRVIDDQQLAAPATREALDLAYLAYCRARWAADQLPSEFPILGLRLPS